MDSVIRKLDRLGRVVLPMKARTKLHIDTNDSLEIYISGTNIVLKKVNENACVLCGNNTDLISFKTKPVCKNCTQTLHKGLK